MPLVGGIDGSLHEIARGALSITASGTACGRTNPTSVSDSPPKPSLPALRAARQTTQPMTGVADPAMFAEDGGPSIAQRMITDGVIFRPADNKRVAAPRRHRRLGSGPGAARGRRRRQADAADVLHQPGLIRTLPALQHDDARPEDVDSDMEDHAPDSARYACMSRPFVRDVVVKPGWIRGHERSSAPAAAASRRAGGWRRWRSMTTSRYPARSSPARSA